MRNSYAFLASPLLVFIFLLLIPEDGCVRIIGGHEVAPHSRPYMALLKFDQKKICAGALIAEQWVLTAAHCNLNSKSQVILGAHSIAKNEPEKQILSIKNTFPHPCYDLDTHENDLKLLQLNKKAKINKNVNILQLPGNGDDVAPETVCHVAGWGKTHKSPVSDILREVNITIIDRKICSNAEHYNFNPVIGLNMICAGNPRGGKGSCTEDSGSPLVCKGVFRGIACFSIEGKCGDPAKPSIYTLLSKKYIHWINKTIKKNV